MPIIDFHNHLIPAVDDGAQSAEEARAGIRAFREAGIGGAVVTPHFEASLTRDPVAFAARLEVLDRGWAELQAIAAEEQFQVWRGAEIALDIPTPDLGDERIRLAGTKFVLVEFAFMTVPPNSPDVLANIRAMGLLPILAHPERYGRVTREPQLAAEWRAAGAYLQVNGASLLGRYGNEPKNGAMQLLQSGMADFVCTDYHTRGRPGTPQYRQFIEEHGGVEQAMLLLELNPQRMIRGELPVPVPPLARPSGLLSRMKRLIR